MRAADGVRGADGGSGGGGDGVASVNGDTGPDVTLDAVAVGAEPAGAVATHAAAVGAHPISKISDDSGVTSPASTGAAALLKLNLADLRVAAVIRTLADLDAYAPAIAGVRTINDAIVWTGAITLPANERIVFGLSAVIVGATTSAECRILGNVDAPLVSGPLVIVNVTMSNSNTGVNACAWKVTTTSRVCRIEHCSIAGSSPVGGIIGQMLNILSIERLLTENITTCVRFESGQTVGVTQFLNCAWRPNAGGRAIEIPAGAILARAVSIVSNSFITAASTDRSVHVSSSAVFVQPSPLACIQIQECQIAPGGGTLATFGRIWDDGVGTIPRNDPRVVLRGNVGERDSGVLGDAIFNSAATPIITSYVGPAPTAWIPIAHQNVGPTATLTLLAVSARFSLFRNPGDVFDWYLQNESLYTVRASCTFTVVAAAVAGGGAGEIIEYRVERSIYDPGAGTWGAWTAIDGSDRPLEQRTNYQTLSCQAFELISWRDRFRVSSHNTSGTAQTKTRLVDVAVVAV